MDHHIPSVANLLSQLQNEKQQETKQDIFFSTHFFNAFAIDEINLYQK